jgi:putative sterol carrier protein
MTANEIVRRMPAAFDSEAAGDMEATVQYQLSEPMYVVIESGECHVFDGTATDPEVTLSIDDDDFVALMQGELNAMNAFMSGKLKLDGDLLLAQRLAALFDASKL